MGTRSITHIYETDELGQDLVCSFYRQYDGYPSGHGQDLADWLKDKFLVNGIGADFIKGTHHNRAGQMAIELIHHIKQSTSVELIPTGSEDHGEDFIYKIFFVGGEFLIESKIACGEGENITMSAKTYNSDKVDSVICPDED